MKQRAGYQGAPLLGTIDLPYLLVLAEMRARGEYWSGGQDGVKRVTAPMQVREQEDVEAGGGGVSELSEEEEALGGPYDGEKGGIRRAAVIRRSPTLWARPVA